MDKNGFSDNFSDKFTSKWAVLRITHDSRERVYCFFANGPSFTLITLIVNHSLTLWYLLHDYVFPLFSVSHLVVHERRPTEWGRSDYCDFSPPLFHI